MSIMRPISLPAPDFPIKVLPEQLQAVISYIQQETQASSGLIAASVLGVMAFAGQDVFDVEISDKLRYPTSLYQVVLAESGDRKSTIDKLLMRPFRELESMLEAQYMEAKAQHDIDMKVWGIEQNALAKALTQAVKNGNDRTPYTQELKAHMSEKPIAPLRKRLFINDATSAALKQALGTGWPSLGLISDEAGSVFNGELLRDTPLLNTLWSAQSITVDRVSSGSFLVEDARLGIMLMVQPGLFESYVKRQGVLARQSGFSVRCLTCRPSSTIGRRFSTHRRVWPPKVTGESLEWFHTRAMSLLNQSMERRAEKRDRVCLRLSSEACVKWHEEYDRIEGMIGPFGMLVDFKDYASKQLEHVSRIAGVLEGFVTGNNKISESTMSAAITIANWYFNSFRSLVAIDEVPDDIRDANLLESWLESHLSRSYNGVFLKTDIRKFGPSSLRNIMKLNSALDALHRMGRVSFFKEKGSFYIAYYAQNKFHGAL